MLMLSGPVELLFLLFLMAVCTCYVVMIICVGCSLRTFLVLLMLCSAVFVECLVLNPCCVGMFGMLCVM